ncbi:hypothetical protein B0H13DRAFT_1928857 [Mycena leptocephala]|nr:hypothetical protein B0H13DRAFT_1928857 [Mycena leptocephala]
MGRHGDDSRSNQCPHPRPCHQTFRHFDFNSSSRRAQETASPESGHTPHNAEGRSICIKAEKIVGDRGPKGMRDSKPAGQPSCWEASPPQPVPRKPALLTPADYSGFRSDVDPRSHVDIGEPRPEVWTYFRGEPEQLQQLDQGVVVRLGGAQGEELQYDVRTSGMFFPKKTGRPTEYIKGPDTASKLLRTQQRYAASNLKQKNLDSFLPSPFFSTAQPTSTAISSSETQEEEGLNHPEDEAPLPADTPLSTAPPSRAPSPPQIIPRTRSASVLSAPTDESSPPLILVDNSDEEMEEDDPNDWDAVVDDIVDSEEASSPSPASSASPSAAAPGINIRKLAYPS